MFLICSALKLSAGTIWSHSEDKRIFWNLNNWNFKCFEHVIKLKETEKGQHDNVFVTAHGISTKKGSSNFWTYV